MLSCQFQSSPFHLCYRIKPTSRVPQFTTAVTHDIFTLLRGAVLFLRALFVLWVSSFIFFCYKCHYYFLEVVVRILWNIVAQRTTLSVKRNSSDHEVNLYKEKRMPLCFWNGILYSSRETSISFFCLKCVSHVCICVCAEKLREGQWHLKP